MVNEKMFRTKSGYCHILPDKIVLTRDGVVGELANLAVGHSVRRVLFIYGIFSGGLLYLAFGSYEKGELVKSISFGLIALYLIYGVATSLKNSATLLIERNQISEVRFKKALWGLTRSRFEVLFTDEGGKTKKRLILLPSSLVGGADETKRAIEIMVSEGLMKKN